MKNSIIPVISIVCLMSFSCENMWDRCIEGNGYRRYESRSLREFERIEINGDFEVQIDTDLPAGVTIETDENLLGLIVTHVSGNKLIIETRHGACIKPTRPVEINVSTRTLREITLNGSGLAYCYGLETEELSLYLTGSGSIECDNVTTNVTNIALQGSGMISGDLVADFITTQLRGSGEIKLRGGCISADHTLTGSGNIKAGHLDSDDCIVHISGSGTVDVHVNQALDVTIIGSGTVYYSGDPAIQKYISGSGKIKKR